MSSITLDLVESEAKIMLEALIEMESRIQKVCDSSEDEDEIADFGNDLIEVRLLLKPFKEKAVNRFGENIINFSREAL